MVFGGRRVGGDLNGLSQYMYILYNIYTHTATRTHTHVYLYIHLSNNNSSYFLYTLTEQPPLTPVVPFTEMLFFSNRADGLCGVKLHYTLLIPFE